MQSPATRVRWLGAPGVDVVATAALAVAVVVASRQQASGGAVVVGGLMMAASVGFRRRAPAMAILLAGAGVSLAGRAGDHDVAIAPVVFALDYYMVGRRSVERGWSWIDAAVLVLPLPGIATNPGTASPGNPLLLDVAFVWSFFFAVPFVAGRAVAGRGAMNAALQRNAERLEHEQRRRARQLVVEERNRISRELHDVVAHSVSVMVIQTAAARRVATSDPAAAAQALEAVETCGREALVDMRRMIGVVHRADLAVIGGAAPGVAQLDKLAERARAAGLVVRISVDGAERPLPDGLDLLVFRIVQEALTNVIKHAGAAETAVTVRFAPARVELEISDSGPRANQSTPVEERGGQGLLGMQERVALYGGTLLAGPRRGGGFRVVAEIPLTDAARA